LFVGTGIALSQNKIENLPTNKGDILRQNIWRSLLVALILFSIYILTLNFQSLRMQKIVSDEISMGKLTLNSEIILKGFPWIPDNNIFGEPINVQKARYLFKEKKFTQSIALLKNENSNPYDSRREFFLASSYIAIGKTDSALLYNKRVLQLKPYLFENIAMMCAINEKLGRNQEMLPVLEKYIESEKYNDKAWLLITSVLDKSGNVAKAIAYSDSAYKYLPGEASIIQNRDQLKSKYIFNIRDTKNGIPSSNP
jgi:tetratricopeptide (TPR) repeat protein